MNAPVLSLWHGKLLVSGKAGRTPTDIVRDVATRHGLTLDEIRAPTRERRIAHPRQEAMWELRQRTKLSLAQIAQRVGLTDHTTVRWGIKQHAARMCGESVD